MASADRAFGPAIERPWSAFTAKLIQRSGASVVPIRFPGQNSRAYQIASLTSQTIRQGLLLYEVKHALNRPQRPHIGRAIAPEQIDIWRTDPMGLVGWVREETLKLGR